MRRAWCSIAVAAVLAVGAPAAWSWDGSGACSSNYGPGAFTYSISGAGRLSTSWSQQLLCLGSDGSGCGWSLSTQIYELTQFGWYPASFSNGSGSSIACQDDQAQCGQAIGVTQPNAWGTLILSPYYAGQVKIAWWINNGPCGGGGRLLTGNALQFIW